MAMLATDTFFGGLLNRDTRPARSLVLYARRTRGNINSNDPLKALRPSS